LNKKTKPNKIEEHELNMNAKRTAKIKQEYIACPPKEKRTALQQNTYTNMQNN